MLVVGWLGLVKQEGGTKRILVFETHLTCLFLPPHINTHAHTSSDTHPYTHTQPLQQDMRVVFADGTVLDTADEGSRASFLRVGELAVVTDNSTWRVGWLVCQKFFGLVALLVAQCG